MRTQYFDVSVYGAAAESVTNYMRRGAGWRRRPARVREWERPDQQKRSGEHRR